MHSDVLRARIDDLFNAQLQGVLATQQHAQPYTSLMAFAHTPDLRYLTFATYRDTQKHANLLLNSAVSFLVDDRSNDSADYQRAVAISVCGFGVCVSLPWNYRLVKRRPPPEPDLSNNTATLTTSVGTGASADVPSLDRFGLVSIVILLGLAGLIAVRPLK